MTSKSNGDLDNLATKHSRTRSLGHRAPVLSIPNKEHFHDRFDTGRKLGEGHFGATFECTDRSTGCQYAMKRLSKARLVTLGTPLEEVQREVGILYHLQGHPNVIQIVGAYEDSRYIYIVMELCRGGELYDRIVDKGMYSEQDAVLLVKTIISVVAFCHSMGVVHRDLKPENFLFLGPEDDSPLEVIDFGLSLFFKKGEPITAGMAGSPLYLAPEMVASHGKHYTEAVDVWSAGVIMYMLLSGYCPFPTDLPTMDELFDAILYDEIDYSEAPWPSISKDAKELLQSMLCRDPQARITAQQALEHPWLSQAGVAPDTPMDPTILRRLRNYSRMTQMRKLAVRIVAQHLSEEQILGLRELFRQIDTDKSGSISPEELKIGLEKMGANVAEHELEKIFSAVDVDENKTLDLEEFIAATLGFRRLITEENLIYVFEYMDRDGSGYITLEELQHVCTEFGITTDNVAAMFAEIDTNKDNKIDYTEFVALMHRRETSKSSMSKSNSLGKDRSMAIEFSTRMLGRSKTV